MGWNVFGLNIDIPFVPTIKGAFKGLGYLLKGDLVNAGKAVMKGISDDFTGQVVLTLATGGAFGAASAAMCAARGLTMKRLFIGGLGLGVANGAGFLDTPDEKHAKLMQQQAAQGGGKPQFEMNWGSI
jgi:hypothetical protein